MSFYSCGSGICPFHHNMILSVFLKKEDFITKFRDLASFTWKFMKHISVLNVLRNLTVRNMKLAFPKLYNPSKESS